MEKFEKYLVENRIDYCKTKEALIFRVLAYTFEVGLSLNGQKICITKISQGGWRSDYLLEYDEINDIEDIIIHTILY